MRIPKPTNGRPERRGMVAIAGLVAVFLVFGLSMAFLELAHGSTRRHRHAVDQKQALYMSEAGLVEGYAGLTVGKTGNVGTPQAPARVGDGLFWVEANDLGDGLVELRSTALVGSGRVTLGLAVERVPVDAASLGVFSNKTFKTNPNSFLDGYDSAVGTYGEHVAAGTNEIAVIGSNGDIEVGSNTEVLGDARPGPTGSVSLGSGARVTGSTQSRPAGQPLPPVELPNIPLDRALVAGSPTPLVLPSGDLGFQSLEVRGGSEVVLTGPMTLLADDLSVASHGTLIFDNRNGPVDVYVTDTFTLSSGSMASTLSDDAREATIQVASSGAGKVLLGADALFYGRVYAPQATVKVLPAFELFGTLVADDIDISSGSRMHYDANTRPTRRDVLPPLWAWRVVDIPDAVAGRLGDPFQLLGVDRDALPSPARAHEDVMLSVTYLDLAGLPQTYDGWESGFDWTKVKAVLFGTRNGNSFQQVPKASAGKSQEESAKEQLSPEEQALFDRIESTMSSTELSTELQDLAPGLSDVLLMAAINRVPPMDSRDLYWPLHFTAWPRTGHPGGRGTGPLSDDVLMALLQQPAFASQELGWLLDQCSPLNPAVLDAAINRDPPMKNGDLNAVLRAQ